MNSKKILSIVLPLLLVLSITVGYWKRMSVESKATHDEGEHVHIHAGFHIYVNGELQDFSSFRYMSLVPCGEHGEKLTPEEEQHEKAHLHEAVGDIVHVHRPGATWSDLFTNINYTFDPNQGIVAYVNGTQVSDILSREIQNYESIVIMVGQQNNVEENLKNAVTKERIEEVEKQSELCGQTS